MSVEEFAPAMFAASRCHWYESGVGAGGGDCEDGVCPTATVCETGCVVMVGARVPV